MTQQASHMPYACSADVATRPRKRPVRVGPHPAPVVEGPLMTYTTSTDADESVACCIAGCGPAGAVLGLLLARAGVEVLVLEKHAAEVGRRLSRELAERLLRLNRKKGPYPFYR